MEGVDRVLTIGQIQPKIMNRFNWDEIGKFIAESKDFPQQLTLDDAAVEDLDDQQQAAAQQEQGMQEAERAAAVAGDLPPEMLEGMQGAAASSDEGIG